MDRAEIEKFFRWYAGNLVSVASEFQQIPPTNPENGLTGYFLSPEFREYRGTIPGDDIRPVVVPEDYEKEHGFVSRFEAEQWLERWTPKDRQRLALQQEEALELKPKRKRSRSRAQEVKRAI